MPSSTDAPGDALPSVLLVAAGVLAPVVLAETTSDLLALYLSGETFTAIAAVVYVIVNQSAAGAVAVTDVEMNDERVEWSTYTLAVELDGSPAERRVVVTDPLGDRTVQRVPRSALADGAETVRFRTRLDGQPREIAVANGEYHVEVTTLAGTTVAERRYTFEELPPLSATVVEVPDDGPVTWNDRPVPVVPDEPPDGPVVVENPESARVPVQVELRRPDGERIATYALDTPPTERFGVVLSPRSETVTRLHERTDGRAVVVVRRGEQTVARVPVTIPAPASANASG